MDHRYAACQSLPRWAPFLPRERLHLPEFSGKPRCICSEIPKELLPLNPETFHEKLWVQAWVIFLCVKGYVWKNKQSRASPSKNICRTLHVKSTTIQQNMTSRNWKTRRQTWQIFVSFCSYSSCKPNNVIVFEYVMSDRGSICEGPGFWGEEEEVCITLTSGAAAPAVPPYPSRYSHLCRLLPALPFIINYTLVTCKTHGGTETADRCTTSFMMLLWLPEIPLWLLWSFYSHIEYKNV